MNRDILQQALAGDFALMGRLMAEWDIDAQLLQSKRKDIRRLSAEQYVRAQLLSRGLKKQQSQLKFLPQSYAAASILLAIASPEQLVALPKGFRRQSQLFPKALTDKIPEDVDRFNSERLFLDKPDIAFVSSYYSHPAAIDALQNQGITIATIKSLDSINSIQEAIVQIGQYAQRMEESELLNLFIDAALMSIDNRRQEQGKVLYLSYYTQLTTPSKNTFTYEQLQKLNADPESFEGLKCSMAVDQERLLALNPECLIISSRDPEAMKAKIERESTFQSLKAVQERRIYFLDDDVQQAASQYAVLAYFDLIQAISGRQL
ncbi:MAG: ABC transporter substrate-binding protein [Parachlamydia sp.]|nr:ABC transporter substrate-binding protein [Parachlamydia sp.]